MLYSYELTIPASTAEADAVELDAPLAPGVIRRVFVQFPSGCFGLVHVQAWERSHQAFPTNPDADLAAENQTITWDDDHDLLDRPWGLTLRGWNDDDTYPHTITWRFAVLERTKAEEQGAAGLIERFRRVFGG